MSDVTQTVTAKFNIDMPPAEMRKLDDLSRAYAAAAAAKDKLAAAGKPPPGMAYRASFRDRQRRAAAGPDVYAFGDDSGAYGFADGSPMPRPDPPRRT